MPHKAEGRREPKPWATGLLKLSIILFAMIPLYFFMGGFFTPYMATGAAREIGVCISSVLLVLPALTVGPLEAWAIAWRRSTSTGPCLRGAMKQFSSRSTATWRGQGC